MKFLLLLFFLVFAEKLSVASATGVVLAYGPWPLCETNKVFCVAPGKETYLLEIGSAASEASEFVYLITYQIDGEVKMTSGRIARNDTLYGYTDVELCFGGIVEILEVEVNEVATPEEAVEIR